MYRKFLCLIICSFVIIFHAYPMDKKEKHSSLVAKRIGELLDEKYHHRNINSVELRIIINPEVVKKNREALTKVWHDIFFNALVIPEINRQESYIMVDIDATNAHRTLKKFYKLQSISKILRHIASGKITSPIKPFLQEPTSRPTRSLTICYGLACFSGGWLGKIWWDNGGKKLVKDTALLVFNTIKSAL